METENRKDGELARRLQSLAQGPELPSDLEDATVGRLIQEGLLARRPRLRMPELWGMAASLALFLTGFLAGHLVTRDPGAAAQLPDPSPSHALLLYGGPQEASREEALESVRRYSEWARRTRPEGRVVGGEPLGNEARVLGIAAGSTLATVGPLRGFFLIDAADLEAATQLALDNPHLEAGGVVEVRPIGP